MILKVVWRVLMGVLRVFEGCCRVFEVCLKGVQKNKIEVWNQSDPPPFTKLFHKKSFFFTNDGFPKFGFLTTRFLGLPLNTYYVFTAWLVVLDREIYTLQDLLKIISFIKSFILHRTYLEFIEKAGEGWGSTNVYNFVSISHFTQSMFKHVIYPLDIIILSNLT